MVFPDLVTLKPCLEPICLFITFLLYELTHEKRHRRKENQVQVVRLHRVHCLQQFLLYIVLPYIPFPLLLVKHSVSI